MATSHELLRVDGLGKTFLGGPGPKVVLRDIAFDLSRKDSLAIVGPSGCGKTTLLLMIAGLIPATKGGVWLEGEEVAGPSKKIALVLQHYGLLPWKTVEDNVSLGARLQRIAVPDGELQDVKRTLGIEGLDHLYPAQLSGGQRQRVALARAILLRPSLLLLDEPFAAIDTITRERLQNGLLAVFNQRQFSFIIVTHSFDEAVFMGKRIMVFDNEMGIATILNNPAAGDPEYRSSPEFFRRNLELRKVLE
ncbi:MAG: ATP-binding cassette domain-containing protein [Syntrophobacterales bacterium]|jgi:NitT/TauT family transport system ATP-binding protein|nr:ATP-binding cassette domain-containing protein [Syntrophobacterales bacterium]